MSGIQRSKSIVDEAHKRTNNEVEPKLGLDAEIDIFNEDNEFSVFRLLSKDATSFKNKILAVPQEYREMDHYELRKLLKPGPTLNQLRVNFWTEYDKCLADKGTMRINNVIAGVCSRQVFHNYCSDPEKMAWILTPVQSYQMGVQDILETSLFKMREGLEKLDMKSDKNLIKS